MRFLIKDLSRLTGLSPARIRKWQERFQILSPVQGRNGYHYYGNHDLRILLNLKERLAAGQKLKSIISLSREELLSSQVLFRDEEWALLNAISRNEFRTLEENFNDALKTYPLPQWIRKSIHPAVILTGEAWSKGILSVADVHAFSHWLSGYILSRVEGLQSNQTPLWLVTSFPGDQHELGALLHYARLLYYRVPVRFCGMLPEKYLIKELQKEQYRSVSISVVIPRKREEIERLRSRIKEETGVRHVHFGGYGYKRTLSLKEQAQ